jgi:signal peptidase II
MNSSKISEPPSDLGEVQASPPAPGVAEAPSSVAGSDVGRVSGFGPGFVFFGSVASVALLLDVASKAWAEITLSELTGEPIIVVVKDQLTFTLAYNPGGAWGLFQHASEAIRKPFFFCVSMVAIVFIVSLYRRITSEQRALKWGLPLVLGGALGNLADRIIRGSVVDFIDYRADWVASMNEGLAWVFGLVGKGWYVTDHWPTFNVADMAICVGVGLMAIDMLGAKRRSGPASGPDSGAPGAPAEMG